jgi:hypothetical protein
VSKKSRTFQPPTTTGGTAAGATTPAATPVDAAGAPAGATPPGGATPPAGSSPKPATATPVTPASAASRSAARRTTTSSTRISGPPRFFEKYRAVIIGVIAVVVIGGAIAVVASQSSTSAAAYSCTTLLTPGPTDPVPTPRPATPVPTAAAAASTAPGSSPAPQASPWPQPTQKLGFTTEDMGRAHVDTSKKVDYDYCPPASGSHYNVGGRAPLPRQFYPPTTALGPGNWIHNLEHGYVVLLYKGEPTADVQQQLQDIMDGANQSATCGYSKVIAVRFDDMDPGVNFAAVAWDRELLLNQFDKAALLAFANQWQDGPQTPEVGLC